MPPIQNLKSKIQNLKGRSINLHSKNNFLVGVISDTHGHLHPAVVKAFKNVDLIVHAGEDRPGGCRSWKYGRKGMDPFTPLDGSG